MKNPGKRLEFDMKFLCWRSAVGEGWKTIMKLWYFSCIFRAINSNSACMSWIILIGSFKQSVRGRFIKLAGAVVEKFSQNVEIFPIDFVILLSLKCSGFCSALKSYDFFVTQLTSNHSSSIGWSDNHRALFLCRKLSNRIHTKLSCQSTNQITFESIRHIPSFSINQQQFSGFIFKTPHSSHLFVSIPRRFLRNEMILIAEATPVIVDENN